MIKIISFKICPFVQRVIALLEAKEIPYQVEYISLSDKPRWFLDISPNGQVPVLVTDQGQALFESDAIAEYIDEIATPLLPELTAEQKALNHAWSYQASKHYLVQCSTMRSADKTTLDNRLENLAKTFAKAEKALSMRPASSRFFNGNTISNVDIAWLVLLHRADIIRLHTGFDMLDGYPLMQRWQQALLATGLADKSVAKDFEKTFTNFYLSHKSWLGQQSNLRAQSCDESSTPCATSSCC